MGLFNLSRLVQRGCCGHRSQNGGRARETLKEISLFFCISAPPFASGGTEMGEVRGVPGRTGTGALFPRCQLVSPHPPCRACQSALVLSPCAPISILSSLSSLSSFLSFSFLFQQPLIIVQQAKMSKVSSCSASIHPSSNVTTTSLSIMTLLAPCLVAGSMAPLPLCLCDKA